MFIKFIAAQNAAQTLMSDWYSFEPLIIIWFLLNVRYQCINCKLHLLTSRTVDDYLISLDWFET